MRFLKITRENLSEWQAKLEALEQLSVYPLGQDAFRISHGRDYFAFFERMGEVHYYALEDAGELVVVGCGVLRPATGATPKRWYIADVKVHPSHRGRHLPVQLIRRAFLPNWLKCGRGYAIAMDPADGRVPPAVRAFAHFKWIPMSWVSLAKLDIYSGDAATATRALPILVRGRERRRAPRFISLEGKKDLILESTKQRLALLHLTFGGAGAGGAGAGRGARAGAGDDVEPTYERPQNGAVHMWCLPRDHAATATLSSEGIKPIASATFLQHRLAAFDLATIETSEI